MRNLTNSVQLIGNLGQDVELREFDSGKKRASFTLATHDYYTDKNGEKQEKTEWHNIVAWANLAEWLSDRLSKGDHVLIQGKITYRKYVDKEGETKYTTEIVASDFMNLIKK